MLIESQVFSSMNISSVIARMRLHFLMQVSACAAMILYLPACDEALPPYIAPAAVVAYGLSISGNDVTVNKGVVTSGGRFIMTAQNVSDEVISDDVRLVGSLTIQLRGKPETSRSLVYTQHDLLTTSMVVGSTLIIEPNQILILNQAWDHSSTTDIPYWNHLLFTKKTNDKGVVYYESETAWMQVSGSLKLFDRVQAVTLPQQEFPVTYFLWGMSIPPPTAKVQ
jgi:hypothetical protein